jgi:hypothetical protein
MGRNKFGRTAEDRKFLPKVEALEERCCPTSVAFQDGETLHIVGNDLPDTVAVVVNGGLVTTNTDLVGSGAPSRAGFNLGTPGVRTFIGVEEIEIDLNGGNDAVFFYSNGFLQGGPAPNAFVQAALNQQQQVVNFLLATNVNALIGFSRFGEELEIDIDGEDGFDAVFSTFNNNFNFNRFDVEFDDIEALAPAQFSPAGTAFPGVPFGFFREPGSFGGFPGSPGFGGNFNFDDGDFDDDDFDDFDGFGFDDDDFDDFDD